MATNLPTELKTMLKPPELAARLGVSESLLEKWRMRGQGPPFIPSLTKEKKAGPGPGVRYRISDVEEWEKSLPTVRPIAHDVNEAYEKTA